MNLRSESARSAVVRDPNYRGKLKGQWRRGVGLVWVALAASVLPGAARAQNLAPLGNAILGYQAAVDTNPGTLLFHVGSASDINDADLTTHVDNWSAGSDQGQGVSFVGILWPNPRYEQITSLTLTMAAFVDGGWFGPNGQGPGAGGALTSGQIAEPTIQVSTNGGTSWTTVAHTSDYLTALLGATIGGGENPNPTPLTATFTLTTPASNINGIRLIGPNGGNAGTDANGFLGVYELEVWATFADTDADGLPDAWEQAYGLSVGVNDANADPDNDSLSNSLEYQTGTDPKNADTDGDGLNDGVEINTSLTNPKNADTDGDGLNDGAEVNTAKTNPLIADTDEDGLSDGAEVNTYKTNPLLPDTDSDGYSDSVEVALGSDPTSANSIPGNLALTGTGIIGTRDNWVGTDTPYAHVGTEANINDGNLSSRVDTWNDQGTDKLSYVGIVWGQPQAKAVARLKLTLATFYDGGWFGPNNRGPGTGQPLTSAHLTEPTVQISMDGGSTWTDVAHKSDYLTALNGHRIGGGTQPNPSSVTATFTLPQPATGISGIRIIGTEGGTASGGFLGVFELQVYGFTDTDQDGMDDNWENDNGLKIGTNDAALDADNDGLTNLQEYQTGTDPQKADTDGDGLTDGAEVNQHKTNPTTSDTDADGLSDGAEINQYHTNPLAADTDGDFFADGSEVRLGSDPTLASSVPANLALRDDATGIIGTADFLGGTETPYGQAGSPANINDGNLTTRVDTWNGNQPTVADTLSYVGVVWSHPVTQAVSRLQFTLAAFFDGGWFGTNGQDPGAGGTLTPDYLVEPTVQIMTSGSGTWTTQAASSDYLTVLNGATIGGGTNPNPMSWTANFTFNPPVSNFTGLRLIGSEGGTASGGFVGVFELAVLTSAPQSLKIATAAVAAGKFQFEFDSQAGATHVVQFKDALGDAAWQVLSTITGDGTRKQVSDNLTPSHRFYRVMSQ